MKKALLLLASLILAVAVYSQSPQAFRYQAVVRDNNGEIVAGQAVKFRFSIHTGTSGGTTVYQETDIVTTNQFGLASVSIGAGTVTIGSFPAINWGNGNKYLETEIDPSGGNNFTSMGTSQLVSVPYSLYSSRSENAFWNNSGINIFYDEGNIGAGTSNPATTMHIAGPGQTARGQLSITDTDGNDPLETFYAGNDYKMHLGYSGGIAHLSTVDISDLILQGYSNNVGNVGIGWNVSSEKGKLITKSKDGKNVKDVSHKLTVANFSNDNVLRLVGPEGAFGYGAKLNFGDGDFVYLKEAEDDKLYINSALGTTFTGGNVGIGTTAPSTSLHVSGSDVYNRGQLTISGSDGADAYMTFYAGSNYKMNVGYAGGSGYISTVDGSNLIIQGNSANSGNVGIGYNVASEKGKQVTKTKDGKSVKDVSHKLTIANFSNDNVLRLIGSQGIFYHGAKLNFGDGDYVYLREDEDDGLYIYSNIRTAMMGGYVGVGTTTPVERLTVRGNVRVESASTGLPVVELGEGLDYAEGFNIAGKNSLEPGTVLSIDPENPGELTESKTAYDTKVAGIVAGAGDLGSGVKLGSGSFDANVALAGRVYCNVDASYGKISPGDLLTTSPTPGFAMVVKDHQKAQGAIIGKAMEPIKKGEKKQILVLVTLQ